MKSISKLMTPQPHCISADAPIAEAHRLMGEGDLHHLPVLQDGKLVGVVSERDLLRLEANSDVDKRHDAVRVAMSAPAFWVLPETPVAVVARQMFERHVGSAVVVSEGAVVGIFTRTDGLQALSAPAGGRLPH